MNKECRNCIWSVEGSFDEDWKVEEWYCPKYKKIIPAYIHDMDCPGWELYESNLHDHDAARPSPQTRDNGIHQEE